MTYVPQPPPELLTLVRALARKAAREDDEAERLKGLGADPAPHAEFVS